MREEQAMWSGLAAILLAVAIVAGGCATTPGGVAVPAADVDAVNQVIQSHRVAFNARNLDGLLVAIADDAKVVSLPVFGSGRGSDDAQVTKVQYRTDMAALMARGDRTLLEHAQWAVSFTDPTHATATGQVQVGERKADFEYRLEKRDGRWMIVESSVMRK
jgi:ketosteroid isomerase-like protein